MNALLEPYLPIDYLFTYSHLHALTYLISTYLTLPIYDCPKKHV
jgi:hypothetical protein